MDPDGPALTDVLLDTIPGAVAIIDGDAVITRVSERWTALTAAHGHALGDGDPYFDVFGQPGSDGPAGTRIADGVRATIAGPGPEYVSEFLHHVGEHRWLVGVDCRPLAGHSPPAFICVHEHLGSGVSPARPTGAFDLDLADIGHGLRRIQVALSTLGPPDGPRPSAEKLARILAEVGAAVSTRTPTTLRHVLCDAGGAQAVVEVMEGAFGGGMRVRGTVTPAGLPAVDTADDVPDARFLDAVEVAVIARDSTGRVTYWSPGAERLYGWRADEVVGVAHDEFSELADSAAAGARRVEIVGRRGRWEGSLLASRKDGSRVPVEVRLSALGGEREPTGVLSVAMDIGVRVSEENEARRAHDYISAIAQGIGEGVFAVDENGMFQFVNAAAEEMLGWSEADLLGRPVAEAIERRRTGRGARRLSRIDRARAERKVVHINDDLFIRRDGFELPVGYAVSPFASEHGDAGSVVVFRDISAQKVEGQKLQTELAYSATVARVRRALVHDEFVLYAQPVFDLRTRAVHSHELLIRMREPNGQLKAPGQFLPAAERSGLIVEIDEWVIRQGAELAARGHSVSVNVSAASVGDPSRVDVFAEIIDASGADPHRITMELTETALIKDERPAREFIDGMRELGCEFALDDFGTGYGGFTYVKNLDIDYLKIDREFIRDLHKDPSCQHVVEAIVSLARSFNLRTIAEGVESRACLAVLSEFGVDYVQGYRLKRPAPLDRAFPDTECGQ